MAIQPVELQGMFIPVAPEGPEPGYQYHPRQLGTLVERWNGADALAQTEVPVLVLAGIQEERLGIGNEGNSDAPDFIRKAFYRLYANTSWRIIDIGNLPAGHTTEDTEFAVSRVSGQLIKNGYCPILLGGSMELTFAQYMGYESLEQLVNLVSVEPSFDLGFASEEQAANTYLGRIVLQQPSFLFNFSTLGYQSYLIDPSGLDLLNKLFFDACRIGLIRDNPDESEPLLRNADLVAINLGSVRQADAPGHKAPRPNGFYAEEICQIAWYAGLGDKINSLGLYELNPACDQNGQTAGLAAQILWCFADGFFSRKSDYPYPDSTDHVKYRVLVSEARHEVVFYKSLKTNRWWMSVPYPMTKRSLYERQHLVPCHYRDYQTAIEGGIPDKWWQTFQKLV